MIQEKYRLSMVTLPLLALSTCFAILLFYVFVIHRRYYMLILKIPSPLSVPFFGSLLLLFRHKFNIIQALGLLNKQYGDYFTLFAGRVLVFVSRPEDMEIVCNHPLNQDRGPILKGLAEILGTNSLITVNWDNGKEVKKIFHKAFNQSSQEIIFENFHSAVEKLLLTFESHEGDWIKALPFIKTATSAAICGSALSANLDGFPYFQDVLQNHFERLLFVAVAKGFSPLHRNEFLYKYVFGGKDVSKLIEEAEKHGNVALNEKKKELLEMTEKGMEVPNQFIFNLMRAKPNDSNQDLLADIKTLLAGGLDTSASTSSFALVLLAMHPEIQQRVYEEDLQIQGELDGELVDARNIAKYDYLSRVIKETLRMYPAVPNAPRIMKEDTKFGKFIVPEGALVMGSIISLHRDSSIYEKPTEFNPDRFLPENMDKLPKFSYLPFGFGPRSCPGLRYGTQSAIFFVSAIIRKYKVFTKYSSIDEVDRNLDQLTSLFEDGGFPIRLVPR